MWAMVVAVGAARIPEKFVKVLQIDFTKKTFGDRNICPMHGAKSVVSLIAAVLYYLK